jgi:hypothetical protein
MVFVGDDLGTWLVATLADAGRKWLMGFVFGTDQERALRRAATAAVQLTAQELRPDDPERAEELAMVISQVFSQPVPDAPLAEHTTLLGWLQAGIAAQLAVLDDASLTGTGQSSAGALGLSGTVLAQRLTGHLVREIVVRGSTGGALEPLAAQLNHDVTHLQGQRLEGMLGQLAGELRDVTNRLSEAGTMMAAIDQRTKYTLGIGDTFQTFWINKNDPRKFDLRVATQFYNGGDNIIQVRVDEIDLDIDGSDSVSQGRDLGYYRLLPGRSRRSYPPAAFGIPEGIVSGKISYVISYGPPERVCYRRTYSMNIYSNIEITCDLIINNRWDGVRFENSTLEREQDEDLQ